MAKYEIIISHDTRKGREWLGTFEFDGIFTSNAYKIAVSEMLFWAGQSYEYGMMNAEIRCDGMTSFFLFMDTAADGSTIRSKLWTARPRGKKSLLREMIIAE